MSDNIEGLIDSLTDLVYIKGYGDGIKSNTQRNIENEYEAYKIGLDKGYADVVYDVGFQIDNEYEAYRDGIKDGQRSIT